MSAAYTPPPGTSTVVPVGSKRGLKIGIAVGAALLVGAGVLAFVPTRGAPPEIPPISPAVAAPPPVVVAPVPPPPQVPAVAPATGNVPIAAEVAATSAAPEADKDTSSTATKKKKKKTGATAAGDQAGTEAGKGKDAVKGRFGTTFVNDYE
jgi:hypothetical protein